MTATADATAFTLADRHATFGRLYPHARRYAYRVAQRVARHWPAVSTDDLVAAGMSVLWDAVRRGQFDHEADPVRLACLVASRGALTGFRLESRRVSRELAIGFYGADAGEHDPFAAVLDIGDDPADGGADDGFRYLIGLADAGDRELLRLRFGGDGLTLGEIATATGVSQEGAAVRFHKAMGVLRDRVRNGDHV